MDVAVRVIAALHNKRKQDQADAYHAHLDECVRCKNEPFNQCPTGAQLLEAFGAGSPKKTD